MQDLRDYFRLQAIQLPVVIGYNDFQRIKNGHGPYSFFIQMISDNIFKATQFNDISLFAIPTAVANSLSASGEYHADRNAERVGIRGSSHPSTNLSFTSCSNFRLLIRVYQGSTWQIQFVGRGNISRFLQ